MKVFKWVESAQEVEIEITTDDIRAALAESFSEITADRLGEDGPRRSEIVQAFNLVGQFLNAVTDDQVRQMLPNQIGLIAAFLTAAGARYEALKARGE